MKIHGSSIHRSRHLSHLLALTVLVTSHARAGSVVWSADFETDVTADWSSYTGGGTDTAVDYFFDYSAVGIPKAPNSAPTHATRGLKLQANLTSGIFGGVSASPNATSLPDEYTLSFDWWANTVGPFPGGGSGSTNLSTFGVGTSGTRVQWPGGAQDSAWFGATGDGGSSADWRAYSSAAVSSYQENSPVYLSGGLRNNTASLYSTNFPGQTPPSAQAEIYPSQTGTTQNGASAFKWRRVQIVKKLTEIAWFVDGVKLVSLDPTTFALGGSNLFFGHSDINATSSTDANAAALIFTLIDNATVEEISVPLAAPTITSVAVDGGQVRVRIKGTPGGTYQLESSDDLVTPFAPLGAALVADQAGEAEFTDAAPPAGQRYYTVTQTQ